MASPQEYTSMPSAARSTASSSTGADTPPSGASTPTANTATSSCIDTAALIQQLAKAHQVQRDQKCRIADLHEEHEQRLRQVQRDNERRVGDLLKELEQCRKREAAVQEVFVQNFEQEQGLAKRERELEERDISVHRREFKSHIDDTILEIKERQFKITREEGTVAWERKILEREECLKIKQEELDDVLGRQKVEMEPDNYPGLDKTTYSVITRESKQLFKTAPSFKQPTWFNSPKVDTLRRHDYYKGWLDCMKAFDTEEAVRNSTLTADEGAYINDVHDYRSPRNVGVNVGLLFGYSAVCKAEGVSNRDDRLDDRVWTDEDLVPKSSNDSTGFWAIVALGSREMAEKFRARRAAGIWMAGAQANNGVARAGTQNTPNLIFDPRPC